MNKEMSYVPRVSIIIPVLNGENSIGKCLDALMTQTYPSDRFEIIVVDNGSKDRTADVVSGYKSVKLVSCARSGSSYSARNEGIKRSAGDILAFTDADCVPERKWLEAAIEYFRRKEIGCLAGKIESAAPGSDVEYYQSRKGVLLNSSDVDMPRSSFAKTANAFYRKEVFREVGLFREGWMSGGDADMTWRMIDSTSYLFLYVPGSVVLHKHRADRTSMFRQNLKWGIGNTTLARLYPIRRDKGNILRVLKSLIVKLPELIKLTFEYNRDALSSAGKDRYFDLISSIGWDCGRLLGRFGIGIHRGGENETA